MILSSSGSWIGLSFYVCAHCVCAHCVCALVLCLFRILPIVCSLILCLCSLYLCSHFVSVSDITSCALFHSVSVLIVFVLSFCVCLRVSTHSFCATSCVCSHCSLRHRLAPASLCSFLSRFVSVCMCLLVHSVSHRAFTRIVLCCIVLHLRHFSRITCIAAAASGLSCTVLR